MKNRSVATGQHHRPAPEMNDYLSCFKVHPNSLESAASVPTTTPKSYGYGPAQFWNPMNFPELNMHLLSDLNETDGFAPVYVNNYGSFQPLPDFMPCCPSPTQTGSAPDSPSCSPATAMGRTVSLGSRTDSDSGRAGHSAHCDRHCHQHKYCSCEHCERKKIERRKEQNRTAQRNHRMRSEARLEQLLSKVKEQADEIDRLEAVNQTLLKRLEHRAG